MSDARKETSFSFPWRWSSVSGVVMLKHRPYLPRACPTLVQVWLNGLSRRQKFMFIDVAGDGSSPLPASHSSHEPVHQCIASNFQPLGKLQTTCFAVGNFLIAKSNVTEINNDRLIISAI